MFGSKTPIILKWKHTSPPKFEYWINEVLTCNKLDSTGGFLKTFHIIWKPLLDYIKKYLPLLSGTKLFIYLIPSVATGLVGQMVLHMLSCYIESFSKGNILLVIMQS